MTQPVNSPLSPFPSSPAVSHAVPTSSASGATSCGDANTAPTPSTPGTPGMFQRISALGASYVLGVFNDNFYKQAALLLAVSAQTQGFQSLATLLFALPFVLFSAPAGWLADRYPKRRMVLWAKGIEIAAMLVGAYGMFTLNWPCMLAMIFGMGFNSTLFSPALNGSIPELFAEAEVPRVNALLKLVTTAGILLGIALAGVALMMGGPASGPSNPGGGDANLWGRGLVATGALAVAVLGFVSALAIPPHAASGSGNAFPYTALLDACRQLWRVRRQDPSLWLVLWAESFFYFISTLLMLEINRLSIVQMGLSFGLTSALAVALMVGICCGSLLAARGTPQSWRTLALPALCGIALCLLAVGALQFLPQGLRVPCLFALYVLAGTCGGLYLIPLTSFLQVRPSITDKGRILGLANTLDFSGILLAGQGYLLLEYVRPSEGHMLLGLLSFLAAVLLALSLSKLPAANNAAASTE